MRHRADDNQAKIVVALRELGVSVQITSSVGFGFTDFVTGFRGVNDLVEIKNLEGLGLKYTQAQRKFRARWKGCILTFTTVEEALDYYRTLHVERLHVKR